MHFREYQQLSRETDQLANRSGKPEAVMVPLLGLAGEVGELLSEYKKHLREEEGYHVFTDRVAEELGDLLWYLTDVATHFGIDLEDVAQSNLDKTRERWLETGKPQQRFDAGFARAHFGSGRRQSSRDSKHGGR